MKPFSVVSVAYAVFAASAAVAGNAAVEAPIHRMMEGFNKGDIAAVKAVHVASPTIVDNVAPFRWSGPQAFDTWAGDLARSEAAEGKSDGVVRFGDPVEEKVSGDRAYVITPCAYTFKQHGRMVREEGMTAFTLVKDGAEWKIESWAWASAAAVAVK